MSEAKRKGGVAAFKFDDLAAPAVPTTETSEATPVPAKPRRKTPARPPSREGKRSIACFANEETWEQLSILSVRTRRPVQDLLLEAIDLLFQANGLSRIARDGAVQ
jgi:hypothetical protein